MAETDVFADAFNFLIYDGLPVIRPEDLKILDTAVTGSPYGEQSAEFPVQKFRDVFKCFTAMVDGKTTYLLLGIENQSEIHYAMPVRNMVYDALQYAAQVNGKAKAHKKEKCREKNLTPGEYLGGFYRKDRLVPVITLVIYFGAEEWDAPVSLHEMLEEVGESIMKYVPDYRINLITPAELQDKDFDKLKTGLREVLLYIKYSQDKEKLQKILAADERFRSVDRDAVRVIQAVTGTKLQIEEEGGDVDMCKAIEDMKRDERREGRREGLEETTVSNLRSLMKNMNLAVDQALAALDISEKEWEKYRSRI